MRHSNKNFETRNKSNWNTHTNLFWSDFCRKCCERKIKIPAKLNRDERERERDREWESEERIRETTQQTTRNKTRNENECNDNKHNCYFGWITSFTQILFLLFCFGVPISSIPLCNGHKKQPTKLTMDCESVIDLIWFERTSATFCEQICR